MTKSLNMLDGLDFQPLLAIGLTLDQAKKVVPAVMPFVQLELNKKVEQALGPETMVKLKQQADEQKADGLQSLSLIDKAYFQKTGEYMMEETRLLINKYLKLMVDVIKQARSDEKKFSQSGKTKQLEKLLAEGKADEAVKILEEVLKK